VKQAKPAPILNRKEMATKEHKDAKKILIRKVGMKEARKRRVNDEGRKGKGFNREWTRINANGCGGRLERKRR